MRSISFPILTLFFLTGIPLNMDGQDSIAHREGITKIIFPFLFYLPETKLGIGVTGIITFDQYDNPESGNKRVSQLQPSMAYTVNKQILIYLPFEFYFDADQLKTKGELGYFKYFYNYYGQGAASKIQDRETYDVTYPRLKIEGLYRFNSVFSGGLVYRYDNYNITRINPGGLLDIKRPKGSEGGILSAFGLTVEYDNRDDIFLPFKGGIGSLTFLNSGTCFGSNFEYSRIEFSYSKYFSFANEKILAIDFHTGSIMGSVPFYEQFYIGSPQKSRGTLDRRYMDRNIVSIQQEYRFPIWNRFSGTVFQSLSTVSSDWSALWHSAHYIYAYGLGLRYKLTKEQRVRLRADFAFSESEFGFYFTIGEAF